jgi:hypothetical protein
MLWFFAAVVLLLLVYNRGFRRFIIGTGAVALVGLAVTFGALAVDDYARHHSLDAQSTVAPGARTFDPSTAVPVDGLPIDPAKGSLGSGAGQRFEPAHDGAVRAGGRCRHLALLVVQATPCRRLTRLGGEPDPKAVSAVMADILPGNPRWSKERYRIVPQRLTAFSVQYLLVDSFEDEIVLTHAALSAAMAERDRLDPVR